MNQHTASVLEYPEIIETVAGYALSKKAKKYILKLQPMTDLLVIEQQLRETTEAKKILEANSSVPLSFLEGIEAILLKLEKGDVLTAQELADLDQLLENVRRLKAFMLKMTSTAPSVSQYALSMEELKGEHEEIKRCIISAQVDDRATAELHRIRKKKLIAEERIKQRLDSILVSSQYSKMLQESIVSLRNGRYVLPVKSSYRKSFEGTVLGTSTTGATVFMEPKAVSRLHDELETIRVEEEQEVYNIRAYLSGLLGDCLQPLRITIDTMVHYDFIIAKAKYSIELQALPPKVNVSGVTRLIAAKHPLLGKEAVPLDFEIGEDYHALIITGPNTGGKTVTLKTVGLLTMMAQTGLHIPADKESVITVFHDILADIGDGQSIRQSLSTFSSHVKNISYILKHASSKTLVLLDELGAGTEPSEGVGFAIAVLENIYGRGSTILATTHYNEIKVFGHQAEGFINACMEFDTESLQPLYKLQIGQAGESNALHIARRLGIDAQIIARAREITYGQRDGRIEKSIAAGKHTKPNAEKRSDPVEEDIAEKRRRIEREREAAKQTYAVGDSVYVHSIKQRGIIAEAEDNHGDVTVMIKGEKVKLNRKRISLFLSSEELYPENYDMNIVLKSKAYRKKLKQADKGKIGIIVEE